MLGDMLISYRNSRSLSKYLEYHEEDIAIGINDFGELKELFIEIFKRDPVFIRG